MLRGEATEMLYVLWKIGEAWRRVTLLGHVCSLVLLRSRVTIEALIGVVCEFCGRRGMLTRNPLFVLRYSRRGDSGISGIFDGADCARSRGEPANG